MMLESIVNSIVRDNSLSLEERITRVFSVRQEQMEQEKELQAPKDIVMYSALMRMIKTEDHDRNFILEFMQLAVLLAEAYLDTKDFVPVAVVAEDALEEMRSRDISFQILNQVIPRFLRALEKTVYNHAYYEMLLLFLSSAPSQELSSDNFKAHLTKMLNLRYLLEDSRKYDALYRKLLPAAREALGEPKIKEIKADPALSYLKVDPVEYTLLWESIYYDVEDELDILLEGFPRGMGFCFKYWQTKEDLLEHKYGIRWKSPAMMNPGVMFD